LRSWKMLPMCLLLCLAAHAASGVDPSGGQERNVKRLTLRNGLRVILVRNTSAPVVTVQVNVLVGGNEDPTGFPGLAHAQEHMAFRGCRDMTADQTAAVYAQLGDENNADTQEELTRYFVTVPRDDLDVALEAQAKCLTDVDDSPLDWAQERGALANEVRQTQNDLMYNLLQRINGTMFAGTPYTKDSLGNADSLRRMNAGMLKDLFRRWYAPSNEILIVVGDMNLEKTALTVEKLFGHILDHPVPAATPILLPAFKSAHIAFESDIHFAGAYIAYRLPGSDSADFATTTILACLLQRDAGNLSHLVSSGLAVRTDYSLEQSFKRASVGIASISVPSGTTVATAALRVRRAVEREAIRGFTAQEVESAKRGILLDMTSDTESTSEVADDWSEAVAQRGRSSPEDDAKAIRLVTKQDVDRVARQYLIHVPVFTASVTKAHDANIRPLSAKRGSERVALPSSVPAELPPWVAGRLDVARMPDNGALPSEMTLTNGIHLLVKSDLDMHTITLMGSIKHSVALQTGTGKEGVSQIMDAIYASGASGVDKRSLKDSFDLLSAKEAGGYQFSLTVPKENFAEGLKLLANHQLHPAFDQASFTIAKRQVTQDIAGDETSPNYLAERALRKALLPLGDPALRLATKGTVNNLTLEQVVAYFRATVRPDMTTIVVAGDISAEDARLQLEQAFNEWQADGEKPDTVLPGIPANIRSSVHIADATSTQASVVLAEQITLSRSERDYYALMVGTQVLDGGFYASRLYQSLRRRTGYVYSVNVALNAYEERSTYSIEYDCEPQDLVRVRNIIEHEINTLSTKAISPSELTQAKALLLRRLTLQDGGVADMTAAMLSRAEARLPIDETMNASRIYLDLDAESIRSAFARLIDTRNLVEITLGPSKPRLILKHAQSFKRTSIPSATKVTKAVGSKRIMSFGQTIQHSMHLHPSGLAAAA
jgi:zinc protease